MPDPVNPIPGMPAVAPAPGTRFAGAGRSGETNSEFASALREQLEQVSRMQSQADQGVRDLVTGRSENITEVFSAARKAQVAFSLLMEIRNKLADAYVELRQLRV